MSKSKREEYYIERGYCITEEFTMGDFQKVIKEDDFEICSVVFQPLDIHERNIKTVHNKMHCSVFARKKLNDNTSQLMYFTKDISCLPREKEDHLTTCLMAYNYTTSQDKRYQECHSLCAINYTQSNQFSITKSVELKGKNLADYLEYLIFRAIINSLKLSDNLPLLEENLKRIRDNELYSPTYFRDVELAKPFIVELSRINLVSSGKIDDISLQSAIRKFEDHYVRDVYKGIFLSDGTSDILDKIKNSNEENDEMLKTICDALSDIIFITRISDFERKVNQMSFYISQSNVERPFTFQKCIFFIIRKAIITKD